MVTNTTKECDVFQYWYFLDKGCTFQLHVCNMCYNIYMMYTSLSDIAISNINEADYCCIISGISKSEAVKLLEKADLNEKSGTL